MSYPTSYLSQENVLRDVHDPNSQTLRVSATALIPPGMEVEIDHTEDSVRLGDGTNYITSTVNGPDTGLDVNIINTTLDINIVSEGTIANIYNEVLAVSSGSTALILSYTATAISNLKKIDVSGTNIAEYIIYLNGTIISKKRTYFSGGLNCVFEFDKGIKLVFADLIEVKVLHNRPTSGDFNTNIIILED